MKLSARRRVRLLMRDLGAAAAFGSMAVSGELPRWGVVAFVIAFVVALFDRRILARHGTVSALVLLVGAAGLYFSVATGGFDLVIAASTFAGLITGQRMLSDPSPSTDNQVHLTSLLMISGGAALSGDLLFALCLSVFGICIALSLGLGVIDGAARDQEELHVRPALRQMGVGAVFAVVGGIAFFLLFPRLNWNMAARHMPRGVGGPEAGLSSTIRLGATGGAIKTTARVVARVSLSPDPKKDELDRYFVASRLARFDGRGWDGPQEATQKPGFNLFPERQNVTVQLFELLPGYGSPIAIALSPPVGFFNATALHAGAPASRAPFSIVHGREVRIVANGNGYGYTAWSANDGPVPATDAERAAALELPEKLDPRVAELAKQIVGNERDPSRAAQKLVAWLQKENRYTLQLPTEPVEDPLANFLFVRKEGHCEYFATALTVMLRTLGIPARVAVGFYGGTRTGDHYVLRAGDAHAWTEVLTDDGFVTYDATPESGRRAQGNNLVSWATDVYERVETWWSRTVVDYSLRDQMRFAERLFDKTPDLSTKGLTGLWANARRGLATVATGVGVYLLMRALLRRRSRSAAKSEATLLFEAMSKVLKRGGVEVSETDDVSELVERLRAASHPAAGDVERVTSRYLAARFGASPLRAGEREHLVKVLERSLRPEA